MGANQQMLMAAGAAAVLDYEHTVLADNPTAYWRLGEAAGTSAVDDSGNGHTGTYSGGYALAQTGLITGDSDKSVAFTPSAKVNCGAVAITGNITMEAWVSVGTFPSGSQQAMIISRGYDNTSQPYYIRLYNNGGTIELHAGSYANAGVDAKAVASVNSWTTAQKHHIAGTYDGTNWILYVDGSAVNTAPFAQGAVAGTTNTYLAGESFSGSDTHYFDGTIDEAALYSTALSPGRILAHYNKGA